jgi:NAD(P)-dependent dehydrogenase (short-subunit alcohol dehydrogenase family)
VSGRLAGKVAIVTGGGQGIGAAISDRFAAEGARVAIAQRTAATAEAQAARILDAGGEAVAIATDVTDRAAIRALVAGTTAALGPPDILVNNAGISIFVDPLEATPEDWARCMAVDLEAAWWCSRAVLPAMLDRGGAIINVASSHSFQVIPGCFPYPVAKHGLIGLTRALAAEYAARGVRVNAVCPAYVETANTRDYFESFPDADAERARVGGLHPVGRIGRPAEVAGPVLFLASDDATFVTGEALMVDGGMSIISNGHGVPFVPGEGPSGTTAGLDTSAPDRA